MESMLTRWYIEVPTYALTSIGSQHDERLRQSSEEFDSNYGEVLKRQGCVTDGRSEDAPWSFLVLLTLPSLGNLISFWLQISSRPRDARINYFEKWMEFDILLFTSFLSVYDQQFPSPGDIQLGSQSEAGGTSIRKDLLRSAVLDTYSVGDRTQAGSQKFSSPAWKQGYEDWITWFTDRRCTSAREQKSVNLVYFIFGAEVTEGFWSEAQIWELFETALPKSTLQSSLESSRPPRPILSSTLLTCNTCGKPFPTSELLQHHERTHARPFQCEICHASFSWPKDLRRHLTKHSAAKSFSCPYCQLPFSRKDNVLRHLRNNHRSVQRANGDKVALSTSIESTTSCPHKSSSYRSTRGKLRNRNQSSSQKKRKVIAPCDMQKGNDDNDDSGSPFSPTSTLSVPDSKSRKIICIFRRFNPDFYGNSNERYHTCERQGFNYISELRIHIKRVHGITDCGETQGCALRGDSGAGVVDKWRMEYRKHCDPTPGAAESHCIFWDSAGSDGCPSAVKLGSNLPLDNSEAWPSGSSHQMFPQGVMTRTPSVQTASSSVEQMPANGRGIEQQAIQSLNLQLQRMQSDNDSLRTHNMLLIQHLQTLTGENQMLRADYQALRAEQLSTTESKPGYPDQRVLIVESSPGLGSAAPQSLTYSEAFDFGMHFGTDIPFLENESGFHLQTHARNEATHSMLHDPYLDMAGDLPQMGTSSDLTATQNSIIDPVHFQDARQRAPHLTERSTRSDLEEPAGDLASAIPMPLNRGNAGKGSSQFAFAATDEGSMDWGS